MTSAQPTNATAAAPTKPSAIESVNASAARSARLVPAWPGILSATATAPPTVSWAASAVPWGRPAVASSMRLPYSVVVIEPMTATPSAPATCRVRSFIAEATPALSSDTAPMTELVAGPRIHPRFIDGEHLRRRGRRVEARAQLRPALTTFEGAGAGAWAERARAELRASGETARRGDGAARDELTPQELRIAELVSTGASNRDVGAQLFLSPKTVEYHLRKVFVKLGIGSRTELARIGLSG